MSIFEQNRVRIAKMIEEKAAQKERIIVAIDGRCASGKSTLAAALAEQTGAALVHMDDFFLRPEQRTAERLAKAGENVDHERFLEEVLTPLSHGEGFSYRPWDCGEQAFGEEITVTPKRIAIVEGSYACHPDLWDFYDLRIFLTVSPETQLSRIAARGGTGALEAFRNKWIPLEERYFEAFDLEKRADAVISNE